MKIIAVIPNKYIFLINIYETIIFQYFRFYTLQLAKSTVTELISDVFSEGELEGNLVVRKFRTTADDGKNYETTYYNLYG